MPTRNGAKTSKHQKNNKQNHHHQQNQTKKSQTTTTKNPTTPNLILWQMCIDFATFSSFQVTNTIPFYMRGLVLYNKNIVMSRLKVTSRTQKSYQIHTKLVRTVAAYLKLQFSFLLSNPNYYHTLIDSIKLRNKGATGQHYSGKQHLIIE